MAEEPILNPPESGPAAQKSATEAAKTPPNPPPPKTDIPAGIENKPNSYNGQNNVREWWKVGVETLTLLAVVWYACIASRQLTQMRIATTAAKDSADAANSAAKTAAQTLTFTEQIQEPLLVLDHIDPSDFPDGKNPGFTIIFHNYGSSPAVAISGNVTMTAHAGTIKLPDLVPSGNFHLDIIPGNSSSNRWEALTDSDKQKIAPYIEGIKSGKVQFYIRGFLAWQNKSGKKFPRRDFCVIYSPSPGAAFQYCADNDH